MLRPTPAPLNFTSTGSFIFESHEVLATPNSGWYPDKRSQMCSTRGFPVCTLTSAALLVWERRSLGEGLLLPSHPALGVQQELFTDETKARQNCTSARQGGPLPEFQ